MIDTDKITVQDYWNWHNCQSKTVELKRQCEKTIKLIEELK